MMWSVKMTLARAQSLIDDYGTNTWLIHHHVDGLQADESLLQLPFPANCLNWILGHIVWRRDSAMTALGLTPLWDEGVAALYKTDSDPIQRAEDARPLSVLLAELDQTQQPITAALEKASDADLDRVVATDRGEKPVIEHLRGFHWHETYHVGQLDILQAYVLSKR
jgi:hypothetical protein